jgi:hypothetical protein
MQIELDKDVASALYSRLLKPEKDQHGNTVYTISLNLASELREALFAHVGK